MCTPLTILLTLALATPLWAAPRLQLRWTSQASPTPITVWTIYKRVPGPVESWVLVRLLSNVPPVQRWTDAQVLPGQTWCYHVGALAEGFVESVGYSNAVCGVVPLPTPQALDPPFVAKGKNH